MNTSLNRSTPLDRCHTTLAITTGCKNFLASTETCELGDALCVCRKAAVNVLNVFANAANRTILPFDPELPTTTRSGKPVRILVVYPIPDEYGNAICGLMTSIHDDTQSIEYWRRDGRFLSDGRESVFDLINVIPNPPTSHI